MENKERVIVERTENNRKESREPLKITFIPFKFSLDLAQNALH